MNLKLIAVFPLLFVFLLVPVAKLSGQDSPPTPEPSVPETARASTDFQWTASTTVGQIVADSPRTARIFELVEIDYCCGGKASLGDAAQAKQISVDRLLAALFAVTTPTPKSGQRNWQEAEIGELIDHIVKRHHAWLRRELPSLVETTRTVLRVHGAKHPELERIAQIVEKLPNELLPHLAYEEQTLFQAIKALSNGQVTGDLAQQLETMRTDHDSLGQQLHELRRLTNGYVIPRSACAKYREMLTGLEALERDLHTHVHLENNVLLPRALKLLESANKNPPAPQQQ